MHSLHAHSSVFASFHCCVQIREGSSELIPDAWINLGHMYLYTHQPNLAVEIYTKCMNKFFDGQGLRDCESSDLTATGVISDTRNELTFLLHSTHRSRAAAVHSECYVRGRHGGAGRGSSGGGAREQWDGERRHDAGDAGSAAIC